MKKRTAWESKLEWIWLHSAARPTSTSLFSRIHVDFVGLINDILYLLLGDGRRFFLYPPYLWKCLGFHAPCVCTTWFPESSLSLQLLMTSRITTKRTHVCSPPYHLRSDGLADSFVGTNVTALLRTRWEGTNNEMMQQFLLAYHATLNPGAVTPAESQMRWKLRTVNKVKTPSHGNCQTYRFFSQVKMCTPETTGDDKPNRGQANSNNRTAKCCAKYMCKTNFECTHISLNGSQCSIPTDFH